ncbi:hypothetical protein ROP_23590 [Rhodococcus opacus B4]|uniref:MaoC-like domain-containing protein n=2 Tax=Rhodococcus opacus TaxID=37919 RepID=C1B2I2_RHOOB|nr:hypothetical protein ROP_23590 [Rhodococcus opacus B4]
MIPVYGRDLRIGDRFGLGSHAVTETEIIDFATTWDPQTFHTDRHAAAEGYFGGIIASGIHTLGIFQRLATVRHFTHWRIIAGRGVRELRFVRPVRPGDILTGFFVIENIRAARGTGDVITLEGTLVNQTRDTVFIMRTDIQVHHRPSDAHCDVLSKSGNCHDPSNAGASGP